MKRYLNGLLLGALLYPACGVEGAIIKGMPDAIVCSVSDPTGKLPWQQLVYYVSARMNDGRTLFKTLTSDPVVLLVSEAGTVDGKNLADCDGQSVEDLRAAGRAFDIAQPNS